MPARASIAQKKRRKDYSFFQRASAACLAMRERSFGESLAARALPPLEAPSFASATAAGFFFRCSVFGGM